jgi:hypothetical protein
MEAKSWTLRVEGNELGSVSKQLCSRLGLTQFVISLCQFEHCDHSIETRSVHDELRQGCGTD